ncbi:MAG: methyltransferase domain-containing protein [Clostridiales bacterium]|nr:methyltransferase domain-containing protein [Clostridiales bacterium]
MIDEIQARYAKESCGGNNLSCGGNLDYLNIANGENILDLGCGRGNETIQAAIMAGPEGSAAGLDITQEMITTALKNSEEKGIKNVRFIKGDIEDLPFGENSFDAVMSNCVINHARSKFRAYSEIFRVLKKQGRLVVSDAVTKTPLPPEVRNDPEAWAQCFGGALTEQEYLDSIRNAGFGDITILKRREYIKNGYDFISLTITAIKEVIN